MNHEFNQYLAKLLRETERLHEASWEDKSRYGSYTKDYNQCMTEAGVKLSDPLRKIIACLFTAGFADMWDFCNEVEERQ